MSQRDRRDMFGGGEQGGDEGERGPRALGPSRNGSIADGDDLAHPPCDLLAPADAAALDALLESGWDADAVVLEHRAGALRLMRLLGVIDLAATPARDEALEDVVLLRAARLRASAPAHAVPAQRGGDLCDEDAFTLDALVGAAMEPGELELRDGARARRQLGLLSLLDIDPGTPAQREERIERTLRAVQQSIHGQSERMRLEATGGRSRIQFADLVSVAALLLIGSAVLFSIMDGVRAQGQRVACQTAMHAAGVGFGQYALSSRDALPLASPSRAGTPWWDVGGAPERSNSANLFTLARTGYASLADLACAGNPTACRSEDEAGEMDWRRFSDVSYSYRMMFGRGSAALTDSPRAVVLADRSTVVFIRPGVLQVRVFDNSPNHGGRGQSVLLGDGSVQWMKSPVFKDGDNLWLPRSLEEALRRLNGPVEPRSLQGTETPGGLEDNFVAP